MMPMDVRALDVQVTEERPGSLALRLVGPLTESACAALPERLSKIMEGRSQCEIVVSLEACETVDSTGLGALVSFRLQPQILPRDVVLRVGASGPVHHALGLLRMHQLFSVEEIAQDGTRTLRRCAFPAAASPGG